MNERFDKYLQYIKNTGGKPLVSWFDDDWEPIGPTIRNEMLAAGLIDIKDGIITCKNTPS
jgi:hypothetical protein